MNDIQTQIAADNCEVLRARLAKYEDDQGNPKAQASGCIPGAVIEALQFYSNGDHFLLADPDAWDTCSGEPMNFQHDDAGTASVEDGSIAKAALESLKLSPAEEGGLTFNALRAANAERIGSSKYRICEEQWTPAHWMQATVGELGELANLLKKVDRGDFPFAQVRAEVAKELADVQTYLDILALKLGVDLGQATIDKFNEVSARIGSHVVLGEQQGDSDGFKKGDIVRYSGGCTALARLESPHAGGWHADHCLGGQIFVSTSHPNPMRRASPEDCQSFQLHRAKTLQQLGRTEQP